MRVFTGLVLLAVSFPALAGQKITCFEVNKDGSKKAKGATLNVVLEFAKDDSLNSEKSSVEMSGVWRKGAEFGKEFRYLSADQSESDSKVKFTHISFVDAANGETVEYQLQFKKAVLKERFADLRAVLAVSVENNSSEAMPGWGFKLDCSSKLE